MNYTYRDLLEALQDMSSDELDMSVTIYDRGQESYHKLNYAGKCEGDDKVSADHPILIVNDPEETVSEPHREVVDGEPRWITHVLNQIPDRRSCEVWIEFVDGSEITVDMQLDMDLSIEDQIRDTFESPESRLSRDLGIVNFKWKELGI
jgi:hypothetical protein